MTLSASGNKHHPHRKGETVKGGPSNAYSLTLDAVFACCHTRLVDDRNEQTVGFSAMVQQPYGDAVIGLGQPPQGSLRHTCQRRERDRKRISHDSLHKQPQVRKICPALVLGSPTSSQWSPGHGSLRSCRMLRCACTSKMRFAMYLFHACPSDDIAALSFLH